jgi:ubiquinone/menaquinone biosynthesis C-methylase UbiE
MKLNWAERWVVNNRLRTVQQAFIMSWMLRNGGRKAFSRVLEVGCGRGAGARLMFKQCDPAMLHIMDLDIEMILKAKRYLSPDELKHTYLLVEDLRRLPYRGSSFDAVFGFGVLHHIEDWQGALSEIARILKPGGSYFLEELYPALYQNFLTKHILLHPRQNRFHSHDLRKALAHVGLSIVAEREASRLSILAVCEKR